MSEPGDLASGYPLECARSGSICFSVLSLPFSGTSNNHPCFTKRTLVVGFLACKFRVGADTWRARKLLCSGGRRGGNTFLRLGLGLACLTS